MKFKLFSLVLIYLSGTVVLAAAAETPSVLVTTVSLQKQPLSAKLTGYGVISLDPRRTVSLSFSRAGQVGALQVVPGQEVARGAKLLDLHLAPSESLAYAQARLAVKFARKELQRNERMFAQKLATQAQLAGARKALDDAQAALQAQRQLGVRTKIEVIKAPFAGIVTQVNVQSGDRLQAGAVALQLGHRGAFTAELGVEPEDSYLVQPGMAVRVASVFNRNRQVMGQVVAVHGVVDPQTGLVNVQVTFNERQPDHFIPGMQVLGEIVLKTESSWVVPRSAVLSDAQGATCSRWQMAKPIGSM